MGCDKPMGPQAAVLAAYSTAVRVEWMTGFVPVLGITEVNCGILFQNASNASAMPYYQLATSRPDQPSAPAAFSGSFQSADAKWWKAPALGSSAYWVRFGVGYKSGDTNLGQIGVKATFSKNGWVLVGVNHTETSPFGERAPTLVDLLPASEVEVAFRDDRSVSAPKRRPTRFPVCRAGADPGIGGL